MRVFTVPSGWPVFPAISTWVNPSKNAISSAARCSADKDQQNCVRSDENDPPREMSREIH